MEKPSSDGKKVSPDRKLPISGGEAVYSSLNNLIKIAIYTSTWETVSNQG